jgi:hypothetical protein
LAICRVHEQATPWSDRKASRTVSAGVRTDHGWETTLRVAAAMLTLTVGLLQWRLFLDGARTNVAYFLDFRAFYCSAAVAAAHGDPYRAEPLGECERNTVPTKLLSESGFVVPAPLIGAQKLLAETPWAASVADLQGSAIDVLTKVPTWAGLIALVVIAFGRFLTEEAGARPIVERSSK